MKQELKELGGNNVAFSFSQQEIEKQEEIELALEFLSTLEE